MAPSLKRKKKAKRPPPRFACEEYPNCPEREEIVDSIVDDDPDEGYCSTSHVYETVSGPCKRACGLRETPNPVGSAVIALVGGRVIDIGS
jgi:hypothetical protein